MNGGLTQPPGRRRIAVGLIITGAVAGGLLWTVYARQPSVRDDLASGDAQRMRRALAAVDPEALKGDQGIQTSRLTIDALKKMPVEEMMKLWDSDELSDEQRRRMRRNMRTVFLNYIGEKSDEYFAASKEDKTRILDEQLDEWKAFRDRMRAYRREHEDDPEFEKEREQRRDRWGNQTTEDRRQRTMDMDPDRQAKMWNMFAAMRKRAKQRGMDMGWGPGRGRDETRDRAAKTDRKQRRDRGDRRQD